MANKILVFLALLFSMLFAYLVGGFGEKEITLNMFAKYFEYYEGKTNDKELIAAINEMGREKGTFQKTIWLPDDYGFSIHWTIYEEPSFYLFNKPENTFTFTTDFNGFLNGLKQFPNGAKLDWIEQCTTSLAYDMPNNKIKQLLTLIKSKKFKGVLVVYCNCPSLGDIIPNPETPKDGKDTKK